MTIHAKAKLCECCAVLPCAVAPLAAIFAVANKSWPLAGIALAALVATVALVFFAAQLRWIAQAEEMEQYWSNVNKPAP